MKRDIVDRLEEHGANTEWSDVAALCSDAVAEITRLREALAHAVAIDFGDD